MADWELHYQNDTPPWETGRHSSELQRVLTENRIAPSRAVELGCGSGINAVWLAQQGFDVTGIDISQTAIERAQRRASASGVSVRLMQADLLDLAGNFEQFPFFF